MGAAKPNSAPFVSYSAPNQDMAKQVSRWRVDVAEGVTCILAVVPFSMMLLIVTHGKVKLIRWVQWVMCWHFLELKRMSSGLSSKEWVLLRANMWTKSFWIDKYIVVGSNHLEVDKTCNQPIWFIKYTAGNILFILALMQWGEYNHQDHWKSTKAVGGNQTKTNCLTITMILGIEGKMKKVVLRARNLCCAMWIKLMLSGGSSWTKWVMKSITVRLCYKTIFQIFYLNMANICFLRTFHILPILFTPLTAYFLLLTGYS